MSPMCFSMPASQPSIFLWHVVEARAGKHDLEHDGRHAPVDVFSVRFFFCSCLHTARESKSGIVVGTEAFTEEQKAKRLSHVSWLMPLLEKDSGALRAIVQDESGFACAMGLPVRPYGDCANPNALTYTQSCTVFGVANDAPRGRAGSHQRQGVGNMSQSVELAHWWAKQSHQQGWYGARGERSLPFGWGHPVREDAASPGCMLTWIADRQNHSRR